MITYLSLQDVSISFGGRPLLSHVTGHILDKDRICLIGKNGCGKSTLLRMMIGLLEADKGEIFKHPQSLITFLDQKNEGLPEGQAIISLFDHVERFEAEAMLDRLCVDPLRSTSNLSGGEQRRVHLARALCQKSTILFLDEPTNHLDLPTIEWLEKWIDHYNGAVITISHDRRFLEKISKKLWWLQDHTLIEHHQGFSHFDHLQDMYDQELERRIQKMNTHLRQEMEWLQRGVTARRKRNQGRLERLRQLRQNKQATIVKKGMSLPSLQGGDLQAKLVVDMDHIQKSFQGKTIIQSFTTRILKGDRIGIIGANGSGKTTLLKLLLGELEPDQGHIEKGPSVEFIYLDQMKKELKDNQTLWEFLCPTGGDQVILKDRSMHVMGYLKQFAFKEEQIKGQVSILSGGEKNRLMLAKALAQKGNVLILDEPTNDLDMDTLDLLEDMLSDYSGTLIVVSHDRDFLNRLVSSIIVIGPDGVHEYVGGYDDYIQQKQEKTASIKKHKTSAPPKITHSSHKMSYKDKKDLQELPDEIETYEKKLKNIESQLSEPLTSSQTEQLSLEFEKIQSIVQKLEERYFYLLDLSQTTAS